MSPSYQNTQIVQDERGRMGIIGKKGMSMKDLDTLLQEDWENQGNPNYSERKEKRMIFDPSAPRW